MKTIRAWTRIAVISGVVLFLAACGGGGGGGYSGGGSTVTVPNVVGMAQAAASSSITGAGLTVGTVTMANSNSVASGDVISETPAAGASVASGSAVNLTVSSGAAQVAVPNVVGDTLAAATTAITGANLKVGTVTMAASNAVPSGSVISENPAAGTMVAPASAVNLTVSSGAAQVAVPNVVGDTLATATTAITGANLKVGSVTMASSNAVPSGSVISENPAAGTLVAPASAVNLTVSSGPPTPHYAYVANASDASISAFSLDSSTGALTSLGAAIPVTGTCTPAPCAPSALQEIKIDPSNKYVYVVSQGDDSVYGFSINADGSLTAMATSPFATGLKPQSLAFDATGAFLYVLNVTGNALKQSSITVFSVDAASGALTVLSQPKITSVSAGSIPAQIVTAKTSMGTLVLYVALTSASAVDLFTISASAPYLTETKDPNAPYPTDTGAYGLAVDPAATVLFSANAGSGTGSISSFTINPVDGTLTPLCATPVPSCLPPIPAFGDIGIDSQGKYLFVTEQLKGTGYVDVWPITAGSATGLGPAAVPNSPFATGGLSPNAVSFDASGQWVFSGNDGSANFAEFSLNSATGNLTAVTGSPIAAGNHPDFIAVN